MESSTFHGWMMHDFVWYHYCTWWQKLQMLSMQNFSIKNKKMLCLPNTKLMLRFSIGLEKFLRSEQMHCNKGPFNADPANTNYTHSFYLCASGSRTLAHMYGVLIRWLDFSLILLKEKTWVNLVNKNREPIFCSKFRFWTVNGGAICQWKEKD